jgi:hypothetical protein
MQEGTNSAYYSWVDSQLPPFSGIWAGGSKAGIFAGQAGAFGMYFPRGPEREGGAADGFVEFPTSLRRERWWFKHIRQDQSCEGSILWVTDFKSEPTRLEITNISSDDIMLRDQFGGSGVARLQASDLIHDPKYGLELSMVQR